MAEKTKYNKAKEMTPAFACIFVIYIIVFPIIVSRFTKNLIAIVISPYIAIGITIIIYIIVKVNKKFFVFKRSKPRIYTKANKKFLYSNVQKPPFDQKLYEFYVKIKEERETCPNCNSMIENKNECELCGWERIVCIHDKNLTCLPLISNGAESYTFCNKFCKDTKRYNDIYKHKEELKNRQISQRVKREVWRRDQGRCVECNSKERLEYDHIIPFSKGGSNTARNIQLLCEKCNRSKSNKI